MTARTKIRAAQTITRTYTVYVEDGEIHFDVFRDGDQDDTTELIFDDQAAYELAQALLRGFDILNGIAK